MLISLSEYARKNGKSESYMRRKARAGRFDTAQKIGSKWFIDSNELCTDLRKKSGGIYNMFNLNMEDYEFSKQQIRDFDDIEDAYLSRHDGKPITLEVYYDEEEAKAELAKYKSTARLEKGYVNYIVTGTIYYVESYEGDDNGEFVRGSDFNFAEWNTPSE